MRTWTFIVLMFVASLCSCAALEAEPAGETEGRLAGEPVGEARQRVVWWPGMTPVGPGGPISMPVSGGCGPDELLLWCGGVDAYGELIPTAVCAAPGGGILAYQAWYGPFGDAPDEEKHPLLPAFQDSYGCSVSGFPAWTCRSGSPYVPTEDVVWADSAGGAVEAAADMAAVFGDFPASTCAPGAAPRSEWTCSAGGETCVPRGGARSRHLAALACAGELGAAAPDVACARRTTPETGACTLVPMPHRYDCFEWYVGPVTDEKLHPIQVEVVPGATPWWRPELGAYSEAHFERHGTHSGHPHGDMPWTVADCKDLGPVSGPPGSMSVPGIGGGAETCYAPPEEPDGDDSDPWWMCHAWAVERLPWPALMPRWERVGLPAADVGAAISKMYRMMEIDGVVTENRDDGIVRWYSIKLPYAANLECIPMNGPDDPS